MYLLLALINQPQQAKMIPIECTWGIIFLAIVCLVVFVASKTKDE